VTTTALAPWRPTAVVATGIITVCCGLHCRPPATCCDTLDCSPCCAECPTCPIVQAHTPKQRRENACADRSLEQFLFAAIRAHESTVDIATLYRTTAAAVSIALLDMPMTATEIQLRNEDCPGCANGTSLVHTFTHRCDRNGLAVNHG
jgi:hypothetical protein